MQDVQESAVGEEPTKKTFMQATWSFVKSQHLALGMILAVTMGSLFPEPGSILARAKALKYCTFGIFFISGN